MLEDGEYHCVCANGWAGRDCGISLETECTDSKDNDGGKPLRFALRHQISRHLFAESPNLAHPGSNECEKFMVSPKDVC